MAAYGRMVFKIQTYPSLFCVHMVTHSAPEQGTAQLQLPWFFPGDEGPSCGISIMGYYTASTHVLHGVHKILEAACTCRYYMKITGQLGSGVDPPCVECGLAPSLNQVGESLSISTCYIW